MTLFGLRLCGLPERLPGGGDKRCETRRNYLISMSGLSGSSHATFGSKSQGRYDNAGKYTIMIMVFNIFGDHTFLVLEVEIR